MSSQARAAPRPTPTATAPRRSLRPDHPDAKAAAARASFPCFSAAHGAAPIASTHGPCHAAPHAGPRAASPRRRAPPRRRPTRDRRTLLAFLAGTPWPGPPARIPRVSEPAFVRMPPSGAHNRHFCRSVPRLVSAPSERPPAARLTGPFRRWRFQPRAARRGAEQASRDYLRRAILRRKTNRSARCASAKRRVGERRRAPAVAPCTLAYL